MNHSRGVVLALTSVLAFVGMSIVVRQASHMSAWHTSLARFLFGALAMALGHKAGWWQLAFHNRPWLLSRGIAGGIAITILFYTIAQLGLGKATLISYTYPLFASLLGIPLLGERLHALRWVGMMLSLCGLPLLLQPSHGIDFIAGGAALLGLAGAVAGGFAIVSIRKLHQTDNTPSIFMAFCVTGALLVLPGALWTPWFPSAADLVSLLAIGVFATLGQLAMTEAYRHLDVAVASGLALLVPVANALTGMVWFQESMGFSGLFGAILVLSGCLLLLRPARPRPATDYT